MGNHTVANIEMEISYFNEFLYFCHKVFDVSDIQQRTMSRKILLRNYSFPTKNMFWYMSILEHLILLENIVLRSVNNFAT